MKTFLRLPILLLIATLAAGNVTAQKLSTLTVDYSFRGVEDGYDHPTKVYVYVDGNEQAMSKINPQTVPSSVSMTVTKGTHTVKVLAYALYDGAWEEHLIENNYSIDCLFEQEMNIKKKKHSITLVFDLDKGTIVKSVK